MYISYICVDGELCVAHFSCQCVNSALEQEEALVVKFLDDLLFFRFGEVLQWFADSSFGLCEGISHHLFQVLREGLAHRFGEFSRLVGGRVEVFRILFNLAHVHLDEAFYELLRGDGLFKVVVDAEEGDGFFVLVADEDAAAFDKFAAVVLREIVVDAVLV